MSSAEWISATLMAAGGLFFFAGTIGLLRFPDAHSRLHALTKADNLGLGLVVLGLLVQLPGAAVGAKLVLTWLLALLASAASCYLIAGAVHEPGGARSRPPSADA